MKQRLQQLRAEYENGRREMVLLDRRRQDLRDTLLRIKGAIQILEELIARGDFQEDSPSPGVEPPLGQASRCG